MNPVSSNFHEDAEFLRSSTWSRLSNKVVMSYFEYLESTYPSAGKIIKELVHNPESIEGRYPINHVGRILSLHQEETLIFIPFVYPNHIVVITIDFVLKQVQYYDSKATPAEGNIPYPEFSIHRELQRLFTLCFPDEKVCNIVENTNRHQAWYDPVSCGVFAMTYIKRRLMGHSFAEIMQTMEDACTCRNKLAVDLAG